MAKGIYLVATGPADPTREDEYNDWYDRVHIPELCATPGFVSARRFRAVGDLGVGGHPYLAIYELEADDLEAAVAELSRRSREGIIAKSDALGLDPLPIVVIYEERG